MPRLQDIERFKRDISALSHEAEVLERWGEKPEKITPPEGAAVAPKPEEGAAAAPSSAEPASPRPEAAQRRPPAAPAPEDSGVPPDFATLLESLPLEGEEAEAEPPAAEEEPELSPMPDLGSLLDFEEEPASEGAPAAGEQGLESLGSLEEAEAPLESAEEPGKEAPEAESFDFSLPEFEEESAAAREAEPAEATTPEAPEPAEESLAEEPAELLEEELGEEPRPEAAEETFSIPDFNLAEEEAAPVSAAPSPEAPAAMESAGEVEDFSIPDLEAGFEPSAPEAQAAPLAAPPAAPEQGQGPGDFGDSFESFSFEEPSAGSGIGSAGGLGLGVGPGRDLDTEIASLSEEAPVADTFKLDQDWGDFGSFGGTEEKAPPRPSAAKPKAKPSREAEEKFKPVSLSEAQVDRLQDSLLSFPLNLRVAVEDILANQKGSEAQQSKLVWAMVEGQGADQVALLAGRILKRQIPVPKGYEKRSGEALEAEKGTLAYAFVHTFLPAIKIGLLVLALAGAVGYLGWRYVYVPLAADSLYRSGYRRIAEDRYPEAETDFAKATGMREFIAWYYRYAEAYAAKRQYILAERKYADLVERHHDEKKGILAWARLEKEQLKYEEAVDVLKGVPRSASDDNQKRQYARGKIGLLNRDYFNPEGLLLLGDVYLDWGEEDSTKFEEARRTYATLLERYGDEDPYLERMLLYFIRVDGAMRTDKEKEVLDLKDHFLADPAKQALGAPVLAELGGYLLDKGILDDVRRILLAAVKKDPSVPESHYNLARYYRRILSPQEEQKALDNSVRTFAALPGLGGRRAGMYIDSLIWRGRFLAEQKQWVGAERDFAAAAAEYEKALELRRVEAGGRFGEAYAGLADVAFWQRDDLGSALSLYERAEKNGYATADTNYRCGNVLYRTGRYAEALERLYRAAELSGGTRGDGAGGGRAESGAAAGAKISPYLNYAFGSALYARSDLFAAEAYFRKTAAEMEGLLARAGDPMPQESPSQAEILSLDAKAQNNLGVALYRSAARSGDARRRNEAMAVFARAARLYDQMSQAEGLLQGPEGRNLPLANMNLLLASSRGDGLEVYDVIEKDMKFPRK